MTMQEASKRYHIPMHILQEYQRWGLFGEVKNVMSDWQYDDADLKRLSIIMTLHDIGFTAEEAESYLRLLLEGNHTAAQRLSMLERKRSAALEEIHFKERQLQRLDYLRHEIQKDKRSVSDGVHEIRADRY